MSLNRRDFLHASAASSLLVLTAHADAADPPKWPDHPFLQGNYAPVQEEIVADDLKVIGKLPPEMDGMFVRNGPNPQFPPLGPYQWFDGDGMLHGVRLGGGRASYRNRYVRTAGWKAENKAGKALWGGLAAPPDFRKLLEGKPLFKNAANTALVWHHGKFLALWEGGEPHEIKLPSLDTEGPYTFGGKLKHPFTAHPKVDPTTGEMLFFGYGPIKPFLHYGVVDPKGTIVHHTPIEIPRPVMMHDFAITERHTVFMDLPETFDFARAAKGESPLRFEPKLGARFGVLPRRGAADQVKWFESPACFVFHTLNAYDDGDEVVLLACRMPEFPADLDASPKLAAAKETRPVLYRWRFDLKTGKVREGPLDETGAEFPRINETLLGRQTRYGYLMTMSMDGLLKYDLERGVQALHRHGKGRLGGEGVFVPRPDGKAEDDGWLLTFVHDEGENKSELVVVDAQDFTARPVARVLLPARTPYGFHGVWLSGDRLNG